MRHFIDQVQVLVLSLPASLAAGTLGLSLFTLALDPIIGVIGMFVLTSLFGFLSTLYWFQRNAAVRERDRIAIEHEKLVARVTEIETQSHVLAQAMLPVSAAFQAILVKELTHMHTPEMDALMVKLGPPFVLTTTEAERLAALLEQRTRDMDAEITPSERDAARMMPALMRRVRKESADLAAAPAGPKLLSLMAVVEDGVKQKAIILSTQPVVEQDGRTVLASAIVESARLTRDANDAAKALLKRKV